MGGFLLFAGESCYPAGGWFDFEGEYDSVEEALAVVRASRTEHVTPESTRKTRRSVLVGSCTGFGVADFVARLQVGDKWGDSTVTAVDADTVTLHTPETRWVSYEHDWAHVVHNGEIVAEWCESDES